MDIILYNKFYSIVLIVIRRRHTGQQSKGACLVPKRALRVMEGEANRVLQLTANAVVPISYIVPRKVYISNNNITQYKLIINASLTLGS
jgi:hypothetical protein